MENIMYLSKVVYVFDFELIKHKLLTQFPNKTDAIITLYLVYLTYKILDEFGFNGHYVYEEELEKSFNNSRIDIEDKIRNIMFASSLFYIKNFEYFFVNVSFDNNYLILKLEKEVKSKDGIS